MNNPLAFLLAAIFGALSSIIISISLYRDYFNLRKHRISQLDSAMSDFRTDFEQIEVHELQQTESGRALLALLAGATTSLEDDKVSRVESTEAYVESGKTEFEKGNYHRALAYFSEATEFAPNNIKALIWLGHTYEKLNEYLDAIAVYSRAIESTSGHQSWAIILRRGVAYYLSRNYSAALEDLTKSITLNPNSSLGFYYRALTYQALQKPDAALADLAVVASKPNELSEIGNLNLQMQEKVEKES